MAEEQGGDAVFDVVIVGGSFAGLATAMQLRGFRVLVIDQHPIGTHQTSTCGIPLGIVRALGAVDAILETHRSIILHTKLGELRYPMPEPFVTVDYEAFCRSMLAQTDADVLIARASGHRNGMVTTSTEPVRGRYVVDAAGWRSLLGQSVVPPAPMPFAGRGLETELAIRPDVAPGLHFFVERRLAPGGYAWIFPCGDRSRIGIYSAQEHQRLRERLVGFLEGLGLEIGQTHGGVMPMVRREAVEGEVFIVGDAAGSCLPVSAEGIRVAVLQGAACGRLLAAVLRDEMTPEAARAHYRAYAARTDRFQHLLRGMHAVVNRGPERAMALAARLCTPAPVAHLILNTYLRHSGWSPNLAAA